jgi:AraC family transcriptional regulator
VPENVTMPNGTRRTTHLRRAVCAHTVHVGPYEQLGDAWARLLGEWVPASGNRIGDGVSYEIYLNTPAKCRKNSANGTVRSVA